MDLPTAIAAVLKQPPRTQAEAQQLLDAYPLHVQHQLLGAVFLGRDYSHYAVRGLGKGDLEFASTAVMRRRGAQGKDVATVLHEQSVGDPAPVIAYLKQFLKCAAHTKVDLRHI